jgi:Spy/CpxP family protein refolding chaperone
MSNTCSPSKEIHMKRGVAVVILMVLVAALALAQPPRMTPQERTDRLAKELSLTEKQKAQVLELFTQEEKSRPQMKPSEGGQPPDRDAMRAAMEKIRSERNEKMKKILTAEQYKKYEEMRGPGGMPPGPPRGEKPPEGK